jgi:hypothetical protein
MKKVDLTLPCLPSSPRPGAEPRAGRRLQARPGPRRRRRRERGAEGRNWRLRCGCCGERVQGRRDGGAGGAARSEHGPPDGNDGCEEGDRERVRVKPESVCSDSRRRRSALTS